MNCPSCGRENPEDATFCGDCGASLAAPTECPACGRASEPGQKFCHGCGQRFAESSAVETPERDPRAYTPKHLADKILQSKSAIEGERKQVTVLFADVRESTRLADQVDPEAWHAMLDRFFQILTNAVHQYEGTVNQYTGDGIMALFGAPISHEDHAQRACYAALRIRDGLRKLANEIREERGVDFQTRVGLNSGDVIVGKIGDDLRMDYTAQGAVVHLAQRMEQLAEPGDIYVSDHTARLVAGFFVLHELEPAELRGFDEPVVVYALESAGRLGTRLDLSRAREVEFGTQLADIDQLVNA